MSTILTNPRRDDCRPKSRRRVPPFVRRVLVTAAGLFAFALVLWGVALVRRAHDGLEQARARGSVRDAVRFERARLGPLGRDGVRLFQSTRSVRAVARFREAYFAATDGGLVELSTAGEVRRRFSVLDGLGESDLTC